MAWMDPSRRATMDAARRVHSCLCGGGGGATYRVHSINKCINQNNNNDEYTSLSTFAPDLLIITPNWEVTVFLES